MENEQKKLTEAELTKVIGGARENSSDEGLSQDAPSAKDTQEMKQKDKLVPIPY